MAKPAEPMLASALWTAQQEAQIDISHLVCGVQGIDRALRGVLQHGKVCCISAETNSGGLELCEAYLASHLSSSSGATATIIDTAFSFDVRKFHQTLLARFEGGTDAEQRAMKALERLKIMKVFDFEGLSESILELRDTLEGKNADPEPVDHEDAAPKGTIGDSEDEDEMLDSASPLPDTQNKTQPDRDIIPKLSRGLLLIDSISHITAPMIKNRYVEGQALIFSFMRSLTHLTTTHQLYTMLLSDTAIRPNMKDETSSIFASCSARPVLGRSLEHTLDTHLLVHRASKKATNKHEGSGGIKSNPVSNEDEVSIVEVLQDRDGSAVGRWAAFSVGDAWILKDIT